MYSLLITLLAGLFFLIGIFTTNFYKKNNDITTFSLGLSFATLVLIVIIDIIPECLELFANNKLLNMIGGIVVGIGILFLLERYIPNHHHEDKHGHHHNLQHIGLITLIALIIHNLIEGMGIYGVATSSLKSGLIYALGVGMHNIPFGIQISLAFKNKSKKMYTSIILLTLSTFIGGLFIYIFKAVLSDYILGTILSITIGMILYLLLFELLIELKEHFNKYSLYGIVLGIILILIGMIL